MSWLDRLRPGRPESAAHDPAVREALARWQALPAPDLGRPHFDTRYVVVNTEATGLDLESDRLLAVGAIAIDGGVIDPRHSYYAPLDPDPAAALGGLLEFCGKAPLVVFNAGFNRVTLERAWAQWLGVEPEPVWLDLLWLLPAVFDTGPDGPLRLAQWMKAFDIETFQRHHALGDAWAIAQLFIALQGRATVQGIGSARALAELERTRRQFPSPT
ncbi:3'-5' exonuclease [Pseudothauera rhizosphaerae]|uniref:3'-5' exonuclease n=1 Tax=Pseudothauera rhizosphaerae TaxID=2565932 RepID=A0A4S4AVV6_9RHOO|nr:3'-5' exonuclease [Pseudothauera rhizosphaerae]THF62706.1 3'-5' exonuclease [Pseudothauera rhizosphaerae]